MSRDPIAEVVIELNLDRPLDYLIPEGMEAPLGAHVLVPLRGSSVKGVVISHKQESAFKELKPIQEVLKDSLLPSDLMKLAEWMSNYYLTPLRQVIKTLVPSSIRENKQAKKQYYVSRIKTLEECEACARDLRNKASSQADILDVLITTKKGLFLSELLEKADSSQASVQALVKKGIIRLDKVEVDRSPLQGHEYFTTKPKPLNSPQKEALDKIVNSLSSFKVHLLYGVTGSGKTEIYLQAIEEVLKRGQGVIMLVPEISLTEQTIERFKCRFNESIAILHHRLSDGEKRDEWERIKQGKAKIVIGARSSLFAPMPDLGMIILDEEHEPSFKQSDEAPRYHAREVAIMRAKILNIPVIMGSATPSIESYYNALNKKFELSHLPGRADSQSMPKVQIVDMKKAYEKAKGFTLFSDPLIDGIKKRYEAGEQAILFLNRRGYHSCQVCPSCGEAVKCEHCDTTLTYHKSDQSLSCHLCSFTTPPLRECPTCKSGNPLKFKGYGTEQVEAALKAILPEVRTIRMDADTTKHKGSHQKLFRDFGRGKADVLIGTQMIAKGLHFPEVTLVGVLSCDTSLQIPDFRASEITFQLLTQVAGRAGRGSNPGEVIFQTMLENNRTIELAKEQNYPAFFNEELEIRKTFQYPPFAFLVKLSARSTHDKLALQTLEKVRQALLKNLPPEVELLPVVPAGHAKVKDVYKFNFLIKGPHPQPILRALKLLPPAPSGVRLQIDVNPQSTYF